MTYENEELVILYGSQTGNAQELAEHIWRESQRFYFRAIIKAADEYTVSELLNKNTAIFICSTTGQGEEPQNMQSFWKFLLRKSLPPTILSSLRYAVFGLGDSNYLKFNFVAKRLYKRLLQLGANPIIPIGLGDDQHNLGYYGAADPWIENLWKHLLMLYPLPVGAQVLPKSIEIRPRWNVTTSLLDASDSVKLQSIRHNTTNSGEFEVTVLDNKRLTAYDHFQDVRLLVFQTDGQKYSPGDVIKLYPKNLDRQIEEFKKVLADNGVHIPLNTVFHINPGKYISVPEVLKYNVTFEQLCSEYFDLMSLPGRYIFQILGFLTDSELEKEKCFEFASPEGQNELFSYVNRPRRNIVEVLRDFPNATKNITKEILFEILPPIKPREFSICSSFKYTPNHLHVLLAVVKYKTNLLEERLGLASNYLADLKMDMRLTAWLKKGTFQFPKNSEIPVIMVGPGTGVAPFRSYITERFVEQNSNAENLVLFYGCRNKTKDYLCHGDLDHFHKNGVYTLITAFSRDGPQKEYVQHKILEHQQLVWQLLEKGGFIFVAGNAKNMPQGVRESFIEVCVQSGKKTRDEGIQYIENLEKTRRYQVEVW